MSRQEAHKLLDKILDAGYCGGIKFTALKGNIASLNLVDQSIKSVDDLLLVALTK